MQEPRFEQYLTAGVPAVAMVSGGGDSVALLHLLVDAGRAADLVVYHLNHQLRGQESETDAEFVAALCQGLGVAVVVDSADVASYAAERGLNLEDAGRQLRYQGAERTLDDRCERAGVDVRRGRILTAHTRDDRIETFIARAVSGAGSAGLGSIPRVRGRVVRPLLDIDRAELRDYLTQRGAEWCEDASNEDTSRERSFIRHRISPLLEELNPQYRANLARTMDLVSDDDSLLQSMADGFARDFVDDSVAGEFVSFNLMFMRSLDRTMARRVLRTAIIRTFPDSSRLESAHVERLVDALGLEQYAHDLPAGLRAEIGGGVLRVVGGARRTPSTFDDVQLAVPGTADLGAAGSIELSEVDLARAGVLRASIDGSPEGPIEWARRTGGPHVAVVDTSALLAALTVGPPREGERYRPLGLQGTKKLSDILVDSKVARDERGMVVVVRDGRNVVWVVGQPPSDDYRVVETTSHAITIRWTPA